MAKSKDKTENVENKIFNKKKTVIETPPPAVNLFTTATTLSTTKNKEQHIVQIFDEEFSNLLSLRSEEDAKIKALTKTKEALDFKIKEIGRRNLLTIIADTGVSPKNIVLEDRYGLMITYFSGGSYRKINDNEFDTAEELISKYGEQILTVRESFNVSPEMVKLYDVAISNAIINSTEILDEDKSKIISKVKKFSVTSEFFNLLPDLLDEYSASTIWDDLKPSMSIKEVIMLPLKKKK